MGFVFSRWHKLKRVRPKVRFLPTPCDSLKGSAAALQGIAPLFFLLLGLLITPSAVVAQQAGSTGEWLWSTSFYANIYPSQSLPPDETGQSPGRSSSQILLLGNKFGYQLNHQLAFTADVPVYFVNFCERALDGTKSCGNNSGLGDIGLSLHFDLENPVVSFYSTGTLRLPTGDETKGLGAGSVTASWAGTLSRRFRRATPFLTLIVANSLSQTSSFIRPFTSEGFVVETSGGFEQEVHRYLHVGGSFYAVSPRGTQVTFGRLALHPSSSPSVTPASQSHMTMPGRRPRGPFAPHQGQTTGTAELTRDNGGSAWLRFPLRRNLEFQLTYTRSVRLDLHVISSGIYVNLSPLLRRR